MAQIDYYFRYWKLTILDGYKVRKRKEMKNFLLSVKCNHAVFNDRSIDSLINEWRVHNLLYDLHILRNATKDVDLECGLKKPLDILYSIISIFYFGF